MDNSKVLKPIVGPQESTESKKKESNKKKKALLVSALAFLISTGTIAASIAVVKANIPKLEIKFDDWFVDSFDKQSMQHFIDDNRLSEQNMIKQLPGYVDKKAKDQNVKNADMITNAKFTDKIPSDQSNKFPPGIYIELSADSEYIFSYQANLSLEENDKTKELSNLTKQEEQQRYFIDSSKTKLYILVYERPLDNDQTHVVEDLQTFNDYDVSNVDEALRKLNSYIWNKPNRYTSTEFGEEKNLLPALEVFYENLIGLERRYVLSNPKPQYDKDTDELTIHLNNKRSNFNFIGIDMNSNVSYDQESGVLTLKGFNFHQLIKLKLDTLHDKIQDYIKEQTREYTFTEFRDQMSDETLRNIILEAVTFVDGEQNKPITLEESTNPDEGVEGGDGETETPPPETETPPAPESVDKPKINNMFMLNKNLVIEFKCPDGWKYAESYLDNENVNNENYSFNPLNDQLTVKNLKYFTEYVLFNTKQTYKQLDKYIVDKTRMYTAEEFSQQVSGETTKQELINLIARNLTAKDSESNGKSISSKWITDITFKKDENEDNKGQIEIKLDTDFKKFKLNPADLDTSSRIDDSIETTNDQKITLNKETATLTISLEFFTDDDTINNIKQEIQKQIIDAEANRYTVNEFYNGISGSGSRDIRDKLIKLISDKYNTQNPPHNSNITNVAYNKQSNELTFNITIPKYKKFPLTGNDIKFQVLSQNSSTDQITYKVTVQNLEYWKDLQIAQNDLIETKKKVNKFILDNFITISTDDPQNTVYNEFKDDIYNIFGKTPLSNGQKLSEFMTNTANEFKRKDNNIIINLKSKLDEENRVKDFNSINIPTEYIELDHVNKTLSFNNLEFCSSKEYFEIDETAKEIRWVNAEGRKQKVLRTPPGYDMDLPIPSSNPQAQWAFAKLYPLEKFFMDDAVTKIPQGLFYICNKLQYAKMSKNLTEWKWSYSIYKAPNLSFVDWRGVKKLTKMGQYGYGATGVKDILLPRSIEEISNYCFQTMGYNANTYPNIHLNSIITWANKIGYAIASDQPKVKALVLLADDITPTSSNIFGALSAKSPDLNIYVKSDELKTKLITEAKFGLQSFDSDKIHVITNLEDILTQQGTIPSDW